MLLVERFAPLRRSVESKLRRVARNLTVGGVSLALTPLLQATLLQPVASWISRDHIGLLQMTSWPRWVETLIAIVLLDYTLWWWHWANHRVPFFWRFHLVHHIDRDLDTTTALRFHFGELALSIPVRAGQQRRDFHLADGRLAVRDNGLAHASLPADAAKTWEPL